MFESEERRIAERIKDFIKSKNSPSTRYIMLRNKRLLNIDNYRDMVDSGKITPQDAYMYIWASETSCRPGFYYPFLVWYGGLIIAYLSKLGFYYGYYIFLATGIKYVADAVIDFYTGKYLSIEVVNLDTAVSNTNLRKIVAEVLDGKLMSGVKVLTKDEHDKIYRMFKSQQLFAGYDFDEAWGIIYYYYNKGNKSLAKEVARIAMDYDRIFNPYRVCYETKTWDEVDCWKIKLD